jgi:DNA-binding GntR family transcriptional regulator
MAELQKGSRTKSAAVYSRLRDDILAGKLAPGQRLILRELTDRYQVSAIPLREAMVSLERDGLVESSPHVGARVTTLTVDEAIEYRFLNSQFAALAAATATPEFTEEALSHLDAVLERLEAAQETNHRVAFRRADEEFHRALMAPCPYPMLFRFLEPFWTIDRRVSAAMTTPRERMDLANYEHRAIIGALRRRDGLEVQLLVAAHIYRAATYIVEHLQSQAESEGDGSTVEGLRPARQRATKGRARRVQGD